MQEAEDVVSNADEFVQWYIKRKANALYISPDIVTWGSDFLDILDDAKNKYFLTFIRDKTGKHEILILDKEKIVKLMKD